MALVAAAESNNPDAIEAALQAGASVDEASSSSGATALMAAARAGHVASVTCLLSNGASATLHESTSGSTALMYAAASGHVECCALLLEFGANPIERDANLGSPLLCAVQHVDVLTLLLEHVSIDPLTLIPGADAADATGLTPLMAAARAGQRDAIFHLLSAGASVHAQDQLGATALHAAASSGHLDAAQALLQEGGARADARDVEGRLPVDVTTSQAMRDLLAAALDEQYEHWSEKSYDSAQDDRPWH